MTKTARITGFGSYLPKKVLSNQDLEKMVETSDEWIVTRTGMKERRIAGAEEFTSDMGVMAAKEAMKKANIEADSIDLILVATLTPDHIFPSTACLIQKSLGASHAAAMDMQAACTGYLYAMSLAKAQIEAGLCNNVLIVASEKLSSIVNYNDRNTCILFGDGASACVVSSTGSGYAIDNVQIGSDGNQAELLIQPAGGSKQPASIQTVEQGKHFIHMEGKEVFKHAVRRMESAAQQSLDKAGLSKEDVDYLVPHQANIRIIEAIARRFDLPMEKVFLTIHKYGNTSASSVGIALDELIDTKDIKEGANILLVAFGAGLTWGASVIRKMDS